MIPKDSSVPEINVDTAALISEATTLTGHAKTMRDHAEAMRGTWSALQPVFEIEGTEAIYSKLDKPVDVVDEYVGAFESAVTALEAFAITVAELQRQRDDLLADLAGARILEQNAEDNPDDLTLAVTDDDTDALSNRITGLQNSFEQAEDDCAATLRGINGGAGDGLPAAPNAFLLYGAAPLWQSQAAAYTDAMSDGAIRTMDHLATLSESDAEKWVENHPDFIEAITAVPPPAEAVARWWKDMDSGTVDQNGTPLHSAPQAALVAAIPSVIGNLGGITYSSRHEANRLALVEDTARFTEVQRELLALGKPDGSPKSVIFLALNGFTSKWELEEAIAAATSIQSTLDRSGDAPRSLVQYTPGSPPLAAIAVGNLDTADDVTVNVPGMNTNVVSSMGDWTAAAENLQQDQQSKLNDNGSGRTAAVVAWIGYDTPALASPFVLSSAKAEVGADKLVDFLEDSAATRGLAQGEDLAVLAHSYGAVASTLAASVTPIEHLVLVAAAGVDNSIPTVADLKVDPENVWTTEADQDWTANMGRGKVELGDVNILGVYSQHYINPNLRGYGANHFSSEDAYLGNAWYAGTQTHGISPRTEALLDDDPKAHDAQYGYLDQGTTSLHNAALVTLGYGEVVQKTTPDPDRWFEDPESFDGFVTDPVPRQGGR
jgi:hypothetical protein